MRNYKGCAINDCTRRERRSTGAHADGILPRKSVAQFTDFFCRECASMLSRYDS
jgi:hypothetical protein